MKKRIGIIAAVCFAFALCFALVGCGSGGGGVDKSKYVGTWELESGSDDSLDADSIKLMKSLGLEVTLTLKDDGTGSLDLFGESMELTWEASSNTEGKLVMEGEETKVKLEDGKLTIEDTTEASMTFARQEG